MTGIPIGANPLPKKPASALAYERNPPPLNNGGKPEDRRTTRQAAPPVFAPRACNICGAEFTPTGSRARRCPACMAGHRELPPKAVAAVSQETDFVSRRLVEVRVFLEGATLIALLRAAADQLERRGG